MKRTLLQIVSDNEVTYFLNYFESAGKRGDSCLMAMAIIGQIHEAALRDDKQRVLVLLSWLESFMVDLSGDSLKLLEEYCSILRLAVTDASIETFPDWVRTFYPYHVGPTSQLWSTGKPPKRIAYPYPKE